MSEQINKDRLNELLGIQEGQSFDDYINEGTSMDQTQSVIDETQALINETQSKIEDIDEKFKSNMQVIDDAQTKLQCSRDTEGSAANRIDTLVNVEGAFKSIEDLVDTTKSMLGNVYGIISSCDVLDSETVGAAASLIGETRQLIAEYTGLYKQRVKFFDNVKMEMLKQKNKEDLMRLKYQLDREKEEWKMKNKTPVADANVVDGQEVPHGMVAFGTDDMLKMLKEMEDEDKNEEVVE